MRRLSAVAAILVLLTIIFFISQTKKTISQKAVTRNFVIDSFIYRTNNTNKPLVFSLADGTNVSLQPGSSIKFTKEYNVFKRDIYLNGEGTFKVAKNHEKPFTVKTNFLNTTALGTRFKVSENDKTVHVFLYEGKVVVRAAKNLEGWHNDVYLSPNEQLSYTAGNKNVIVKKAGNEPAINVASKKDDTQNLNFNNASLQHVVTVLSSKYNCVIQYKKQDLKGLNFTGTVSKNDSLSVILKLIASINGLSVEQEGNNSYMISRP